MQMKLYHTNNFVYRLGPVAEVAVEDVDEVDSLQ